MKTIVTEFVQVKVLETTTEEQLLAKADILIDFMKKQDGYIDAELVKEIQENAWCFIFHYENLEKVKAIGEKMRTSSEFDEFKLLLVLGSIRVSFHQQLNVW